MKNMSVLFKFCYKRNKNEIPFLIYNKITGLTDKLYFRTIVDNLV